jgi:hypothetical protein
MLYRSARADDRSPTGWAFGAANRPINATNGCPQRHFRRIRPIIN